MSNNQQRKQFRRNVFERDNNTCLVPWCENKADDAHHILERDLWDDGGYIVENGASVCNKHHQYAETNDIPPQAFYMWANIDDPKLPSQIETVDVNKWGDTFEQPPHQDLRENIKYQSTRHMLPLYWHDDSVASNRMENDDTDMQSISNLVGIPLVITHKIDGGNCMIVSDVEEPVRARNGRKPDDTMRPLYRDGGLYWTQEVNEKLPDSIQVFAEWVRSKHSIHYGCNCEEPCDDVGPQLSELTGYEDERAYLQIFGAYHKDYNLWLSWDEVAMIADTLGFPTTPVIYEESNTDSATYETEHEAIQDLNKKAHNVIENGGEGIVVRSKFPFHYGQFDRYVGKYVRENHVEDNELHWSKRQDEKINQI